MKEKPFTPTHDVTDDEMDDFMLTAFNNAVDGMNQELKEDALRLVRLYINNPNADERNPLFGMVSGFMLGMNEGMNVADVLNDAAHEQSESTLEDIAAELTGISRTITCLVELITPRRDIDNINAPTQCTVESAFFAIERQIDRIADQLADYKKERQPRPTKARIAV